MFKGGYGYLLEIFGFLPKKASISGILGQKMVDYSNLVVVAV